MFQDVGFPDTQSAFRLPIAEEELDITDKCVPDCDPSARMISAAGTIVHKKRERVSW